MWKSTVESIGYEWGRGKTVWGRVKARKTLDIFMGIGVPPLCPTLYLSAPANTVFFLLYLYGYIRCFSTARDTWREAYLLQGTGIGVDLETMERVFRGARGRE